MTRISLRINGAAISLIVLSVALTACSSPNHDAQTVAGMLTAEDLADLDFVPTLTPNLIQPVSHWADDRFDYFSGVDPSCWFSVAQIPFDGTEKSGDPDWNWIVQTAKSMDLNPDVSIDTSVRAFASTEAANAHLRVVSDGIAQCGEFTNSQDSHFVIQKYDGALPSTSAGWVNVLPEGGYQTLEAEVRRGNLVTRVSALGLSDDEFDRLVAAAALRLESAGR